MSSRASAFGIKCSFKQSMRSKGPRDFELCTGDNVFGRSGTRLLSVYQQLYYVGTYI